MSKCLWPHNTIRQIQVFKKEQTSNSNTFTNETLSNHFCGALCLRTKPFSSFSCFGFRGSLYKLLFYFSPTIWKKSPSSYLWWTLFSVLLKWPAPKDHWIHQRMFVWFSLSIKWYTSRSTGWSWSMYWPPWFSTITIGASMVPAKMDLSCRFPRPWTRISIGAFLALFIYPLLSRCKRQRPIFYFIHLRSVCDWRSRIRNFGFPGLGERPWLRSKWQGLTGFTAVL